jgi:hypothetical protein
MRSLPTKKRSPDRKRYQVGEERLPFSFPIPMLMSEARPMRNKIAAMRPKMTGRVKMSGRPDMIGALEECGSTGSRTGSNSLDVKETWKAQEHCKFKLKTSVMCKRAS